MTPNLALALFQNYKDKGFANFNKKKRICNSMTYKLLEEQEVGCIWFALKIKIK